MKANWTIWNKVIVTLSSFMLLWVLAPRHDCFCGTLSESPAPASAATHDCCKVEKAAEKTSQEHDCCKSSDQKEQVSNAIPFEAAFQSMSCHCAAELNLFREEPTLNTVADVGAALVSAEEFNFVIAQSIDDQISMRSAELQNDILKPSKIFLLNCALLD